VSPAIVLLTLQLREAIGQLWGLAFLLDDVDFDLGWVAATADVVEQHLDDWLGALQDDWWFDRIPRLHVWGDFDALKAREQAREVRRALRSLAADVGLRPMSAAETARAVITLHVLSMIAYVMSLPEPRRMRAHLEGLLYVAPPDATWLAAMEAGGAEGTAVALLN
jgi:hypothetical protein